MHTLLSHRLLLAKSQRPCLVVSEEDGVDYDYNTACVGSSSWPIVNMLTFWPITTDRRKRWGWIRRPRKNPPRKHYPMSFASCRADLSRSRRIPTGYIGLEPLDWPCGVPQTDGPRARTLNASQDTQVIHSHTFRLVECVAYSPLIRSRLPHPNMVGERY